MTHEARASAETRRVRTVTCTASISAATHCRLDAFLRQQTKLWKWERSNFHSVLEPHVAGLPGQDAERCG